MNFSLKKYQVVVLDYPIYALNDPFCALMFGKSLKMKVDGYGATYSEKVLPLDKSDFFGTHLIFCEKNNEELIPIFSYKAAPYDRCLKHNFEFPALTALKNDAHPTCLADIQKILEMEKDPSKISFDSSWAQNLEYRFSPVPGIKEELREIMMMVIVKHHQDFNLPHMITCGVSKVKTDLFFLRIGLKKLNDHAHYLQKSMDNEELVIFHSTSFSPEAYQMAIKHQELWDKRLVIDGRQRKRVSRAA